VYFFAPLRENKKEGVKPDHNVYIEKSATLVKMVE
jgi:hypothetical protein